MVDAFHSRRDLVVGLLKEIPGIKNQCSRRCFYVFPDVSSFFEKTLRGTLIKDANDFAMYL
jgi:aspartate aminotransferase